MKKLLSTRDRWVLSYNDCEEIRDMYTEHHIIEPKWSYGMGNSKKSNEILILSKDCSWVRNGIKSATRDL
ncbi:hypothetical protein [Wolbachia endosymbiont (group A) of Anomoia purmunda]|uniref:hypothetical protein n=1 Tax=Wolbachia endosymbiont (group A) of Anomoia purmunda TaxID=2953978 RepID=UPI00222E5DA6|nr:hypothetical protein [Wolbachia endosymbiont (group A) of Anomoia purmunda]